MKFAILGAGGRGQMFSEWLANECGPGSVVAVAEPDPVRRALVSDAHGIPASHCYETWEELLAQPKLADIVINTTQDHAHIRSAVKAMEVGYHMLLEKPMAVSLADCETINDVRKRTGRIVSVCHSLRYHSAFTEVRNIIQSGVLGEVVSYDQLEAVEHIHMSHSFVRGNWGNEGASTFMLLAKSCHDIDILMDMVGSEVTSVSSYGKLSFFRKENAPEGAPKFCVEGCPASETCPYDATKIYLSDSGWARYVGFHRLARQQAIDALRVSSYGKCVFQSDNDVVDHQVVALNFESGATATFTMTAFTPTGGRFIRVHGTKGYLEAKIDERKLTYWEFWRSNKKTEIDLPNSKGAHGGADAEVMKILIRAVEQNDPSLVRTDTETSLRTHTVVFRAEESRRTGQTVDLRSQIGAH
ncbi:MAG: Gfo/Idh/MocA family oxidoreductase [Armatimonadetes bacterium]|nr:Gfo/Idh/MocA family oxidoreductase [Armatimonadota bacterium]MBS1726392.1 Gfo/Idh/MocA family oxidoreductase [Armatimonadota bacterium]